MGTEIIKNLNKHRVCDRSYDKKVITIKDGNCLTIITAGPDGTLIIVHKSLVTQQQAKSARALDDSAEPSLCRESSTCHRAFFICHHPGRSRLIYSARNRPKTTRTL